MGLTSKDFLIENSKLYSATILVFALCGCFMFGLSFVGGHAPDWLNLLIVQAFLAVATLATYRRFRWPTSFSFGKEGVIAGFAILLGYMIFLWLANAASRWSGFLPQHLWTISTRDPSFWLSILVPPVVEEFFFRDLLFRVLGGELKRISVALVISSLAFMIAHLSLYPGAFLLGMINGLILVRTRSLIPCVVFHALSNASIWILPYAFPYLAEALVRLHLFHSFYQ